jgi:hypothetical protein
MKKFSVLAFLPLAFSLFFCKSQNRSSTGPVPTDDPAVYKGVTDNSCAVEMAYGSPGSGIDYDALKKTMHTINSNGLAHSSKSVGREGETRICLPLTELKGQKRTAVIDSLRKIAKEGQFVSISIR